MEKVFQSKTIHLDIDKFTKLAEYFNVKPIDHSDVDEFWVERILMPSTEPGRASIEREFAESVRSALNENPESHPYDVWEKLCSENIREPVAAHARQISATEAVIGLCEWVFDVCRLRGEDHATLTSAADWALRNDYKSEWLDR